MTKILAIGNSFSQDATAFLYDIAKADNIKIKVVNLYIGGCSLQTHWENVEKDVVAYTYELNGQTTEKEISIKDALLEEEWNFVTMQQASPDSGLEATYFPYLNRLSAYVRQYAPTAKQLIHKTWAYEIDSDHGGFTQYDNNQAKMYDALSKAYAKASAAIGVEIIPCGDVIQTLRAKPEFDYANSGQSLCRDGFHMHYIYGRYATAAVWYETILKGNILTNAFVPVWEGEPIDLQKINIIKQTVHAICSEKEQKNV